jgi:hypothetical protein
LALNHFGPNNAEAARLLEELTVQSPDFMPDFMPAYRTRGLS